jgi:hypothetical protein
MGRMRNVDILRRNSSNIGRGQALFPLALNLPQGAATGAHPFLTIVICVGDTVTLFPGPDIKPIVRASLTGWLEVGPVPKAVQKTTHEIFEAVRL